MTIKQTFGLAVLLIVTGAVLYLGISTFSKGSFPTSTITAEQVSLNQRKAELLSSEIASYVSRIERASQSVIEQNAIVEAKAKELQAAKEELATRRNAENGLRYASCQKQSDLSVLTVGKPITCPSSFTTAGK
jgi:uncharacterized protein (UPF0333 family)